MQRRETYIPARHGSLHCMTQGYGHPLVLLHGALGTGISHFRAQIDEFSKHYQVIAPDFLGYGKSSRRASMNEYFYQRDAEDVVALLNYLALPPVNLCGFSDGAVVAIMVAGKHTDLIRSLVLIGGQAVMDANTMEETRKLGTAEDLPHGLQRALAHYHGDPYWKQLLAEYVNAIEHLYTNGNDIASNYLSSISCPTLIIHGAMDPMVDTMHARNLHKSIKRSELALFPCTGHEVQREQPETFNTKVLQFLASASA